MSKLRSLFTSIDLTWKRTVIFAVIAGVYTAFAAMMPAFEDTSFADISISFEWWILFGIIIIMNSRSPKDSALKCFVFFLISQPLVYLLQVPFSDLGFGIFRYYGTWFVWTLLTIPMGFIGFRMKKGDFWGLLILAPMLLLLGYHFYIFASDAVSFFPNHLLSALFCLATMFLYVNGIFSEKKVKRAGNALCALIVSAVIFVVAVKSIRGGAVYSTIIKFSDDELFFDDTYKVSLEDDRYGSVSIGEFDLDGEMCFVIRGDFTRTGATRLILEGDGSRTEFELTIGRNTYSMKEIE